MSDELRPFNVTAEWDDGLKGVTIVKKDYIPHNGSVTFSEAQLLLGISRNTVYRWIKDGKLRTCNELRPPLEPHGPDRIPLSEIKRGLEEQTVEGIKPPWILQYLYVDPTVVASNLPNLPMPPLSLKVKQNQQQLQELRIEVAELRGAVNAAASVIAASPELMKIVRDLEK